MFLRVRTHTETTAPRAPRQQMNVQTVAAQFMGSTDLLKNI